MRIILYMTTRLKGTKASSTAVDNGIDGEMNYMASAHSYTTVEDRL